MIFSSGIFPSEEKGFSQTAGRVLPIVVLAFMQIVVVAPVFSQKPAGQAGKAVPPSSATSPTLTAEQKAKVVTLLGASKAVPVRIEVASPGKTKHLQVLDQLKSQKESAQLRHTALLSMISSKTSSQSPTAPTDQKQIGATAGKLVVKNHIPPPPPIFKGGDHIVVTPCPVPRIDSINGKGQQGVLTPDPQYNFYVIEGCGFGTNRNTVSLNAPFKRGNINLTVVSWNDTFITAQLDPGITGEQDQRGNVTLVVQCPGSQQAVAKGLTFYAVRDTQLLQPPDNPFASIGLQSAIMGGLGQVNDTVGNKVPHAVDFFPDWRSGFPGFTFDVLRTEPGRFGAATDSFSLTNIPLASGFYVSSYGMAHLDIPQSQCPGDFYIDGLWNSWWGNNNAIGVTTQEEHCHASGWLGLFGGGDASTSYYGIMLWVTGPKGVSQW
jgi:hypothetical protein